jgi:hypothetical protein
MSERGSGGVEDRFLRPLATRFATAAAPRPSKSRTIQASRIILDAGSDMLNLGEKLIVARR